MPLIQVFTSAGAPADGGEKLLGELSALLAKRFGKPERYVMTCLSPDLPMTFAATMEPAAFAAVKNVGKMTPDDTTFLSKELCDRLARGLAVARDRIYIEFTDATGYLWGWNGDTFG
jgi:phenylpyruvate tautomerase